jgi:hypothetical protein
MGPMGSLENTVTLFQLFKKYKNEIDYYDELILHAEKCTQCTYSDLSNFIFKFLVSNGIFHAKNNFLDNSIKLFQLAFNCINDPIQNPDLPILEDKQLCLLLITSAHIRRAEQSAAPIPVYEEALKWVKLTREMTRKISNPEYSDKSFGMICLLEFQARLAVSPENELIGFVDSIGSTGALNEKCWELMAADCDKNKIKIKILEKLIKFENSPKIVLYQRELLNSAVHAVDTTLSILHAILSNSELLKKYELNEKLFLFSFIYNNSLFHYKNSNFKTSEKFITFGFTLFNEHFTLEEFNSNGGLGGLNYSQIKTNLNKLYEIIISKI